MSKKWTETGILRKKQATENFDDLLVFGYACKLFRDDERALYIDQGKHLIPWMGNESLKIDRYDGRGALSDLSSCETSRQSSSGWSGLTESELKVERMCDEERYYSLHNNDEEEMMYKEEEAKRQGTNEFKYNYDVPEDPSKVEKVPVIATCEEEDRIFVPPIVLNIPADMEIPKRMKENARIEKTALFVSQQGPQMEILIKAKQSDNPQFGFMNQNNSLHKYYRHLLNAIKSGQYKPQEAVTGEENEEQNAANTNVNDFGDGEHYLHPSLAATFSMPTTKTVTPAPVLPFKPAADCAYTQLVSRIKASFEKPAPPPAESPSLPMAASVGGVAIPHMAVLAPKPPASEHYLKYYQTQYYHYYQQIAHQYATQGNCDMSMVLQNPQLQEQIRQQAVHYAQAACGHFNQMKLPTFPPPKVETITSAPAPMLAQPRKPPEATATETKVSLVGYSSDSDESDIDNKAVEDEKSTFVIPPKDVAVIIDKMATYVAKNGLSFELGVKAKGDQRFDFLSDNHMYHKYYRHKVDEFTAKSAGNKVEVPAKVERTIKVQPADGAKPKEKKIVSAVSFSIKKTKEEPSKDIKSALQAEESDEENLSAKRISPPTVVTSVAEVLCPPKATINISAPTENAALKERCDMIDLTSIEDPPAVEPVASARYSKERVRDRLATAVREKSMHAERRKRTTQGKEPTESRSEDRRVVRADTTTSSSDSELEEGEIKQRSRDSHHKRSPRKKRSKSSRKRRSRSRSRSRSSSRPKSSRRRKYKKHKRSPRYTSTSSNSD